jgi:hypothetical protein
MSPKATEHLAQSYHEASGGSLVVHPPRSPKNGLNTSVYVFERSALTRGALRQ